DPEAKGEKRVKFRQVLGGKIQSSPVITDEGIIYVGSNNKNLYAIRPKSRGLKLARTPWPCYGHDTRNTSNTNP
ncbi:PQQ-binding-like beta-propeller repeat protein, partial [candidate division WOR-3 bacterium]|nr:PQQ-binding-like beta-propeller repeat protein [candidate division WOR-3 bacterium]MBD3363978.1 PQQ-binding-like beta-propeller repeat protein [candidate division WOR-3 bacterium]